MASSRRTFLARLGLATSGAVALAGCAGDSGSGSSGTTDNSSSGATAEATTSGDADADRTVSGGTDTDDSEANETTTDDGETSDGATSEAQVTNELQGAVELVSKKRYTEGSTLYVQASVDVTDAEAIDGYLSLSSEVRYRTLTVGTDTDLVRDYETGDRYDLTAQFPDVDPEKVDGYTITLKALSNEQPNNG
jgi:hypothetical protein